MAKLSPRLLRVWSLFLWSVVVLSLIRIEYILWNIPQFKGQPTSHLFKAMLEGIRFDLAAAAWLILPLVLLTLIPWPARWNRFWGWAVLTLFLIIQIPFWIVNLIDVEFVNFVGRRMTSDVLFILGEAQGKAGGFASAYGILILFSLVMTAIGAVGGAVIFQWSKSFRWGRDWGWKRRALLGLLSVIALVVMTRGGFQKKPLHFVNAQVFQNPALNLVVLNSTFTVLKSIGQKQVPKLNYFANIEEMKPLLNGGVLVPSALEGHRLPGPQNVVVLILESFGREYMGEVNGVKGYTPFLDSLAKQGLFFKNGIANGRRSIEGIPAVLSGIPAMMNEPFVTSTFSNGDFPGLGKRLLAKGYRTSFFHGGNNGTMHFDSYTESSGILSYFGASEYPDAKDNDGVWGIYDGPMLQWMKSQMDGFQTPFFTSFFSLSSHNPYLIPDNVKDRYPEGPLPILKTIAYTDDALKEFFERAEKSPWFKNTLFVITADHTFMPYLPQFDHEIGRYQVPILFYHPSMKWPETIDRDQVVQQIDILPSILDFLGMPWDKPNLLSRSVFVPGERTASVFVNGVSILMTKDRFLVWPEDQEARLYSMEDPTRKNALDEPETKRHLEQRLKAASQYFSDSMRGNGWQ